MSSKKRKNPAEPETISPPAKRAGASTPSRSDSSSHPQSKPRSAVENAPEMSEARRNSEENYRTEIPVAVEDFEDSEKGLQLFLVQIPPGLDTRCLAGRSIPVGRTSGECKRRRVSVEDDCVLDVSVCQVPDESDKEELQPSTGSQLADYLAKWMIMLPSRSQSGYSVLPKQLKGLVTISRSISLPPVALDNAATGS